MKSAKQTRRRSNNSAASTAPPIDRPNWQRWAWLACLAALGFVATYTVVQLTRHKPDAEPVADAVSEANSAESSLSQTVRNKGSDEDETSQSLAASVGAAPRINDLPAPGPAPESMVWIPGGVYRRGNDTPGHRESRPWHLVEVDGFWMDVNSVTNEQFAKFVNATGYVTVAERTPKAEDFPGAPPEKLVAGAVIFSPTKGPVPLNNHLRWWKYVEGANWRHPEGPDSDIKGREKHPVVHVAHEDAQAYCKWAGKRLPTEAEFEFAARGRLDKNKYAWGNEFRPEGKWMANIWQGRFPYENTCEDGFRATAPVGSFPANSYGLYDMAGNVWQWCSDWYQYDYYQTLASKPQPVKNPQGPENSSDPAEPGVAKRVMRGGSYLCTDQYCTAYEVGARGKGAPDTGTNHLGFRCVKSAR
jgi:formylglycine-generating enzyme required for sulfatase activity